MNRGTWLREEFKFKINIWLTIKRRSQVTLPSPRLVPHLYSLWVWRRLRSHHCRCPLLRRLLWSCRTCYHYNSSHCRPCHPDPRCCCRSRAVDGATLPGQDLIPDRRRLSNWTKLQTTLYKVQFLSRCGTRKRKSQKGQQQHSDNLPECGCACNCCNEWLSGNKGLCDGPTTSSNLSSSSRCDSWRLRSSAIGPPRDVVTCVAVSFSESALLLFGVKGKGKQG